MSLETFYASIDGDLDGVRSRLITDERIAKFVGIFYDDPTYGNLVSAFDSDNMQEAFRAAHTLKGVSRDLGLSNIAGPATELADALRPDDAGNPANLQIVPDLYEQVKAAYDQVLDARVLLDQ